MRIMIIGRPGGGKTTFADRLAKKLNIPVYHLDKYFFTSNWIERDYNEFLSIQQNIVSQDNWVIDGCSIRSLDVRYARADVCVYFKYPRMVCLWRMIKRIFFRDPNLRDVPEGCTPSISWKLVKYMWTFEYRKNYRLLQGLTRCKQAYPQVKFVDIRNDKEMDKLLHSIGA